MGFASEPRNSRLRILVEFGGKSKKLAKFKLQESMDIAGQSAGVPGGQPQCDCASLEFSFH